MLVFKRRVLTHNHIHFRPWLGPLVLGLLQGNTWGWEHVLNKVIHSVTGKKRKRLDSHRPPTGHIPKDLRLPAHHHLWKSPPPTQSITLGTEALTHKKLRNTYYLNNSRGFASDSILWGTRSLSSACFCSRSVMQRLLGRNIIQKTWGFDLSAVSVVF